MIEQKTAEQTTEESQRVTVSDYAAVKFADVPLKDGEQRSQYVKVFHIEYRDPESNALHTGTMVARRLTISAYAEQGVQKARLNGGLIVQGSTDFINEMRSYLAIVLTTTPDWWNLDESYDLMLMRAVYEYVLAWEGSFRLRAMAQRRT